jgi:hypothetical protein
MSAYIIYFIMIVIFLFLILIIVKSLAQGIKAKKKLRLNKKKYSR